MPNFVLKADPNLLVLDECRLEALQVGDIGMSCVRGGPAIPPRPRGAWFGLKQRLSTRRHGQQEECDQRASSTHDAFYHHVLYPPMLAGASGASGLGYHAKRSSCAERTLEEHLAIPLEVCRADHWHPDLQLWSEHL
jgi:hypothetical protein